MLVLRRAMSKDIVFTELALGIGGVDGNGIRGSGRAGGIYEE